MSTLTRKLTDLAHQIEVGFNSLKQDDIEELLADEALTNIDVINLVSDNE